jgi:hypothetical protein
MMSAIVAPHGTLLGREVGMSKLLEKWEIRNGQWVRVPIEPEVKDDWWTYPDFWDNDNGWIGLYEYSVFSDGEWQRISAISTFTP